jgi:hypothetical protein
MTDHSLAHLTVTIPGSKSITHRALIAGGLAERETILRNDLQCEDTYHTAQALKSIGVKMVRDGDHLIMEGIGEKGPRQPWEKAIYLGNSGTSFRLLLPVLALAKGSFWVTGTPRMRERPMGPLVEALSHLGVGNFVSNKKGLPPSASFKRDFGGQCDPSGGCQQPVSVGPVVVGAVRSKRRGDYRIRGSGEQTVCGRDRRCDDRIRCSGKTVTGMRNSAISAGQKIPTERLSGVGGRVVRLLFLGRCGHHRRVR